MKKISLIIVLIFYAITGNISAQTHSDNFPKPKHGNTYVIAHRGAHNGIPENSLAAFQKAIDLACDFIEIDTRLTKDKVVVSVHNLTIDAELKVKVFTDDDAGNIEEWKKILSWGTDGIQTDNPEKLIQFLEGL
jgi:glycerophosphoryl diester phosphodiesterase